MTSDERAEAPASRPGDRWRRLIAEATLPESIAGHGPTGMSAADADRFRWRPEEDATQPVRPSRRRALEALPEGGTVLDVGVGGGASSLGLAPRAGLIIGVDTIEEMLESFTASAAAAGVAARVVRGSWPEVAGEAGVADVVVCHHAMYRVTEIEDFVAALTAAARRRVVVELSEHPPTAGLDALWKQLHGVERSRWQVADEAQAVLAALGLAVEREDIVLPPRPIEPTPQALDFVRRRLGVGPERDEEIAAHLRTRTNDPHRVAALWWPGAAA